MASESFMTSDEATALVARTRQAVEELAEMAQDVAGLGGVASVEKAMYWYVRDDTEEKDAFDKCLVEMLVGPQGTVRPM